MKKWKRHPIVKTFFLIIKLLVVSAGMFLFSGCSNDTIEFLEQEMKMEQEIAMLSPEAVQDAEVTGSMQESQNTQSAYDDGRNQEKQIEENGTDLDESLEMAQDVYVYICGAVRNPGVYKMSADSRVFQAVEQAGGILPEAAEGYVNLAMTVTDGQQIYIPRQDEMMQQNGSQVLQGFQQPQGAEFSDGAMGKSDKVNINTADKNELMTISGIGESRAQDIIAYREANGGFSAIEEIMNIPGIKEATFEKIKDGIEVK